MPDDTPKANRVTRIKNIVTVILFCLVIFAFAVITLLTADAKVSERENRTLQQMPELSTETVLDGSFQDQYETYMSDQFPLRDRWVDATTALQQMLGKTDINGVYIGKDGYLIEKYTDEDFDEELVAGNIGSLTSFINDMTATYGSDHVDLLMVPDKANAVSKYLPDLAEPNNEKDVLDGLSARLDDSSVMLDLTPVLQEHQDEYIYYRTDHHWTTLGAYYAYTAFAEKKLYAVQPADAFTVETVADDFCGTAYNKVHAWHIEPDSVDLYYSPAEEGVLVDMNDGKTVSDSFYFFDELQDSDKYRVFLAGNTAKIEITTRADTGRCLLMLKDSFSNCFVPFLADEYDTIIMIDLRYFSDTMKDLFSEYGDRITDVLVMYNVEKFMQDENIETLDYR